MRVADFHCDLLSYLAEDESHTAHNPISRASIPLLQAGGVRLQTLAVYTKTAAGSAKSGSKQAEIFFQLSGKYPVLGRDIKTVLSIENASSFCEEEEPLEKGIERLESWLKKAGKIAYISLTWNGENRFGGGNATQVGLKPEGRELLQWMARHKIAVDLSHTSDRLAEDILDEAIGTVASHSNFRAVAPHPRNLPDDIAQEIAARGGVIGLNFVRVFLGKEGPEDFIRQLEHAEKLGILDHMCFGADFFADQVLPPELHYLMPMFNPGFDNASCYPQVRKLLLKHLSPAVVEKIAYENLARFLT
ncbi:MAG: membrane dipeptidase [Verrucomicrobia bacterium]|nr:membrane dipeptidase [Verrucomicrobiota bacterium]